MMAPVSAAKGYLCLIKIVSQLHPGEFASLQCILIDRKLELRQLELGKNH